jgi:arylsulfatase A-like enzyme/Flp pilus assembly protein TadD
VFAVASADDPKMNTPQLNETDCETDCETGGEKCRTGSRRGSMRGGLLGGLALLAVGVAALMWWRGTPGSDSVSTAPIAGGVSGIPRIHPIRIAPDLQEVSGLPLSPGALEGCNVLLVTLDTTRSDRISCYGNPELETSTLDRLAAEGVVFSRATAVAPTTLPTHASILTGLYPVHHGARVNGLFRLDDLHETLAERLRAEGYRTGAVISAFVLDSQYGLDQGFDDYDDTLPDARGASRRHYRESRAEHTTDRAVRWLRGTSSDHFFLWVHFFDPHHEYRPPERFAGQHRSNLYDGEIAYVDDELGRLLAVLDELELSERTLVVVVGDHGESLGQHGEITHGYLAYGATLRVPLIMRCGEILGGGLHCTSPVSQVDVVPTVLSLLGFDLPDELDGLPLNGSVATDRPTFFESFAGAFEHGWEPLVGVSRGDWKYIHSSAPELYDLAADPQEETNLFAAESTTAAEMKARLGDLYGVDLGLVDQVTPNVAPSREDLEQLQALGYLGGGVVDPAGRGTRGHPREMMPVMHRVEQADHDSKTPEETIAELKEVLREHPDFYPAWSYLGAAYGRIGDLEQGAHALERCIELRPGMPQTVYDLAMVRVKQERAAEALALLEPLLLQYPGLVRGRYLYGTILGQLGRFEEAARQLKTVFELSPELERCAKQMVGAYRKIGRGDEARGILERHLEGDPRSSKARVVLADILERQVSAARAEALLRQGLAVIPDDPGLVNALALLLARGGDGAGPRLGEAEELLEGYRERVETPDSALLFTLASIHAEGGHLEEAISVAEVVRGAAGEEGDDALLAAVERLLTRLRSARAR